MVSEKSKSQKVEKSKPPVDPIGTTDAWESSRAHEEAVATNVMGVLGLPVTERGIRIAASLESVTDPEIPVVSVLDMGMIAGVRLAGDAVEVDLMPTFAGCPALDVIRSDLKKALMESGEFTVTVRTVFDPPWTSDRITADGRRKLAEFGLALPGQQYRDRKGADSVALTVGGHALDSAADSVACPFCHSHNTKQESMFGPTLCRAIHYCNDCLQSFEQFKMI